MPRIGKVKVYTDEGKLIREGYAREHDFLENKIFGLFSPSELVKGGVVVISLIFGAGMLWAKMDGIQITNDKMWSVISNNKSVIGCIQSQLSKCCHDSIYCS
jgi:hypothetical protein